MLKRFTTLCFALLCISIPCVSGCRDDKIIMPNDTETAQHLPNLQVMGTGGGGGDSAKPKLNQN